MPKKETTTVAEQTTVSEETSPAEQTAAPEPASVQEPTNAPQQPTSPPQQNASEQKKAEPKKMPDDEILNDAFTLGWQIVELRSRIQIARTNPDDFTMQIASIWRAISNRIATLQIKAFPDSSTEDTLYAPPDKNSLPYLYPPSPDYGNVGILCSANLEKFQLHEVTRRAINCLTLLYTKAEESLVPRVIKENQEHLIQAILAGADDADSGGGAVPSRANTSQVNEGGEEANSESYPFPRNDREKAIAFLTERTVKFLEAWDGFLRENYFTCGLIPSDDSELVAYEAGHAMSFLSWGVSIQTVPYEKDTSAANSANAINAEKKIRDAWSTIFKSTEIISLQHQISSLSTTLDNAYYKRNPHMKRPDENEVLQTPNPDLPSQAINAIKHSLDYWYRTVQWVTGFTDNKEFRNPDQQAKEWSREMRVSLIEQVNIWQTLMTGQQTLRAYSLESVTHTIMHDVTQRVQKNLANNFKGTLKQAGTAMKEISGEVTEAVVSAGEAAKDGIEKMYGAYKQYFLIGIAVIAVIIAGVVMLVLAGGKDGALGGGVGATFLTTILGYLGLNKFRGTKDENKAVISVKQEAARKTIESKTAAEDNEQAGGSAGTGLMGRIQGAGQEAGKMIMEAIANGYRQIKIELSTLSRGAAISYPLLEFFTSTFTVGGDKQFLTNILWNENERKAEMDRIASAAFGHLAMFIPSFGETDTEDEKPAAKAAAETAATTTISN